MATNPQFYCDICNKTYARLFVLEKHQTSSKHLRNLAEKQKQDQEQEDTELELSAIDDSAHNIYDIVQKQQKEIEILHEKLDKVLLILNKVDQILPYLEFIE